MVTVVLACGSAALAAEGAIPAPLPPERTSTFHFAAGFNAGSVGWGIRLGSGLDWWPLPTLGLGVSGALEARTQVIYFAGDYRSVFVGPTLTWRSGQWFASAAVGWSSTALEQPDGYGCAPCKLRGSGLGAVLSGGYAHPMGRVDLGFMMAYDARAGDGAVYRRHDAGSANLVMIVPLD